MAKPKSKLGRNGYSPKLRHSMQRELTTDKKRRQAEYCGSIAELRSRA